MNGIFRQLWIQYSDAEDANAPNLLSVGWMVCFIMKAYGHIPIIKGFSSANINQGFENSQVLNILEPLQFMQRQFQIHIHNCSKNHIEIKDTQHLIRCWVSFYYLVRHNNFCYFLFSFINSFFKILIITKS